MTVIRTPSKGYAQEVIEFESPEGYQEDQENLVREAKGSKSDWKEEGVNRVRCCREIKMTLGCSIQELLSRSTGVVGVEGR